MAPPASAERRGNERKERESGEINDRRENERCMGSSLTLLPVAFFFFFSLSSLNLVFLPFSTNKKKSLSPEPPLPPSPPLLPLLTTAP